MHARVSLWSWYLAGAVLTLVWHWLRYCWIGRRASTKSMRSATMEWFFEASADNVTSWITTVGLVWTIGVLYIDRVTWTWFGWIAEIPVHIAIAFFLGALMEMIAPSAIKLLASKIPFANALNVLKGGQ